MQIIFIDKNKMDDINESSTNDQSKESKYIKGTMVKRQNLILLPWY